MKKLFLYIVSGLCAAAAVSCSSSAPEVAVSSHSALLEPDQVLKSRISRLYTGLSQEQVLDVMSRRPDRIKGESWFFYLKHPRAAENVSGHVHAGYVVDFRNRKVVNIEPFYRKAR